MGAGEDGWIPLMGVGEAVKRKEKMLAIGHELLAAKDHAEYQFAAAVADKNCTEILMSELRFAKHTGFSIL
jgi:hypothetical protein